MASDPECHQMVEKKYLTIEGKKEEKPCLPSKLNILKKRSDFLNLRKHCLSVKGSSVIINFSKKKGNTRFGITVSKKIGNAVKRNYVKRIIRAVVRNNWKKLEKDIELEIIPKKGFIDLDFKFINDDFNNILKKMNL